MQSYILHHFRPISHKLLVWTVCIMCILLAQRVGWYLLLEKQVVRALQPFQAATLAFSNNVISPLEWIETKHASALEEVELKKTYAQALAQLSELERIKKENVALKALVGDLGSSKQKRKIAAPIISYSLTAISLGREDGINEGDRVYSSDTLLGRVSSVEAHQAFITLLSDTHSQPVLVQTQRGVQGILVGNNTRLELTQIPVQAVVEKGDRVTTVGQEGIPAGEFIGLVAQVNQTQTAPTQTASIDQLQSFYSAVVV